MKNTKIYIKTFGCRLNNYDSDQLMNQLISQGHKICQTPDQANYCIINTCTVTNVADKKGRQFIKILKEHNTDIKVIVMGCGIKLTDNTYHNLKDVDYIISNQQELIDFFADKELNGFQTMFYSDRHRSPVQIQNGCDNYCSFCIIPFTRGQSINIATDKIINEIKLREKSGFKEIILTGVNIGAYGCSLTTRSQETKLADLIKLILDETIIPRIRLSSMGPEFFNDELIDILKHRRICRHLHLSIQCGDDHILRRMNRHYLITDVRNLVDKIRMNIPEIAFSADVIVGFPGETEWQFLSSCSFLENLKLAKLHVFPYSVRDKTVAAKFQNQVDTHTKKERSRYLRKIGQKLSKKFIESQLGSKANVLWLSFKEGIIYGLSDNYLQIHRKGKKDEINTIEDIRLDLDSYHIGVAGL